VYLNGQLLICAPNEWTSFCKRDRSQLSQRAYQQDLQRFLNWTEQSWAEITPRQVALFKRHLMQSDPETGNRILSDATVNRTLGTLKNFYCEFRKLWLHFSGNYGCF